MSSEVAAAGGSYDLYGVKRVDSVSVRQAVTAEIAYQRPGALGIVLADEEEIAVLFVAYGFLARVYAVGVHDYHGFARLAENMLKAGRGEFVGLYHVTEHVARSHGRELVNVADENKYRFGLQGAEKRFHEQGIDHAHFVDDDRLYSERVVGVL
ncbi:unknown [Ruminococcus sp. CAG:382]|nr:unknown [Ruminococcus sp. CAG:382]